MSNGKISLSQFSASRSSRSSFQHSALPVSLVRVRDRQWLSCGISCDPLSFYLRITGDLAGIVADPRFSAYPRKHAPFRRAGRDGGDLFRHGRPCRRCVGLNVIGRADSLVVKSLIIDNDAGEIQAIGRAISIRSRGSDHVILEIYGGGSCSCHRVELQFPSLLLPRRWSSVLARSISVNFTPAASHTRFVSFFLLQKSRCDDFLAFRDREFRFDAPARTHQVVSLM